MIHKTIPRFWSHYKMLPSEIRALADKNFSLLFAIEGQSVSSILASQKIDDELISARVGIDFRALGRIRSDGIYWF